MTTLTLKLSDYEKRYIKMQAAKEGKSMKQLIIDALGFRQKRGTIHEAVKDLEEGRVYEFETLEDLFADWDKLMKEADDEL